MINQICRVCGCTDNNCSQCIEKTGQPCSWSEPNLCSACVGQKYVKANAMHFFKDEPDREYNMTFDTYVTTGKEDAELAIKAKELFLHIDWPDAVVTTMDYEDTPEPEPQTEYPEDPGFHEFEDVE